MAKYPPIDPDVKRGVLEALSQGGRPTDVAAQFNISQNKVYYIQRKAALNGHAGSEEVEEVLVSKETAGHRSFMAKAQQARDDALDALWGWKAIEKNASPEIIQVAIDAANSAANAWRKAAVALEIKGRNK